MKKCLLLCVLLLFPTGLLYGAEGRIPISAPVNITVPGSYIVTDDIATTAAGHAIRISANDVSIDLDGHSVAALTTGYYGIYSIGYTNIRLTNGTVRGYNGGIYLNKSGGSFHVEGLNITARATGGTGIYIRGDATASAYAVVKNNIVNGPDSSGYGIRSLYNKGMVEGNKVAKWAYGIYLETCSNVFVERNISATNLYTGIYVIWESNYNVIRNNSSSENGSGIWVQDSHFNTIESNSASGNTNYGIYVYGGGTPNTSDYNTLEDNTTACASGSGIVINGCGNIYSNNKLPGGCTLTVGSCGTPNIDGGGNIL